MKVLYFALECKPFSKVGGVGDVALELPLALKEDGIDIEIITPYYSTIQSELISKESYSHFSIPFKNKNGLMVDERVSLHKAEYMGINITFIKNSSYFEGEYGIPYVFSKHTPYYDDFIRFHFFSTASAIVVEDKKPDIVHVNDWGLGFLPGILKFGNSESKSVMTIHNNSYQGNMWIPAIRNWSIMEFLYSRESSLAIMDPRKKWNSVNPLKFGIECSDMVNTVSPSYMKEILKRDSSKRLFSGGNGLQKSIKKHKRNKTLYGILNGFQYGNRELSQVLESKKEAKIKLSTRFRNPDNFLIGFVGRAVEQKFRLLQEELDGKSVLEHLVEMDNVNIAILATGLPEYEEFLWKFSKFKNVSVTLAFDRDMASLISIGCDLFLMPSLYEPCGITQMESLSNATPPLVRSVGGLKDTVISYKKKNGTGFTFNGFTRKSILKNLIKSVEQAAELYYSNPDKYEALGKEGFNQRFLWSDSAEIYKKMYLELMQR